MTTTHPAVAPSDVVPPPRPLTPQARRRCWTEPRVRFWWLAGMGLLLAVGYFGTLQTHEWWRRAWLANHGTRVEATLLDPERVLLPGKLMMADVMVLLQFDWKGQPHSATTVLEGRTQPIIIGSKLPLLVDPDNPDNWTWHTEAPSLARELLAAWLLLPVVPLFLLVGWIIRGSLLRCWKNAEARPALVLETSQSALAPLSRAVRCTLLDNRDRRVFTVFVPSSVARFNKGDAIWLLVPSARSSVALAAVNFQ